MTATAREVVADYLKAKQETDKPARQRGIIDDRTRAVIDELPDGFTEKDVRVCVGVLVDDDNELDGMTTQRRNRTVTKTLNDLVADGHLELVDDEYKHRAF